MWLENLRSVSRAALVVGEYSANALVGLIDPRLRSSGATVEEARIRLAGDALLPWVSWQATRAVTVEAPVSEVWPWLAQAGYGRGGWYADMPWWRDAEGRRGRRSSAERLLPDEQHIEVGQVLLDGPGCDEAHGAWTVRICDPSRALVLFSSRTLSGREVDADAAPPRFYIDCSWAFALRPVPAGTRILVRTRVKLNPDSRPTRWLAAGVGFADQAMQRAMLLGIKRRVEGAGTTTSGSGKRTGPATSRGRSKR